MKKIEYLSPETKVIELKSKSSILVGSPGSDPGEAPGGGGLDD
jgi:hypothetical protein